MALYEQLAWDSIFFGYKVASIAKDISSAEELYNTIGELKNKGYRLAYLYKPPEQLHDAALKAGGLWIEKKILYKFSLDITKTYTDISSIVSYSGDVDNKDLISLAIQSGAYSRFKKDSNFPQQTYEQLYTIWMKNTINRSIADELLVYYNDGVKITAMVSLKYAENYAQIGIIAVDELERGKGLGQLLIQKALFCTQQKKLPALWLWTQQDNEKACQFYERNGFVKEKEEWGYHFWL